jgi:nitroreductase
MRAYPIHATWKPPAYEDSRGSQHVSIKGSAGYLVDNFHRVPPVLIPCINGGLDGLSVPEAAGRWGSILPAVWSFMLAGPERGLGSAWVTARLGDGGERAVAEIVGTPYDTLSQVAMFPVAYTIGTDFKPAKREPVSTFLHWDTL